MVTCKNGDEFEFPVYRSYTRANVLIYLDIDMLGCLLGSGDYLSFPVCPKCGVPV